jgi:hypothetical protein
MVVGDEAEEEVEVEEDSEMRTGAIAQGATRQVAARLGDAEARAMIVGARAEALLPEGESAITVLREAVVVDGGAARATQMLVTGATAVIAAVAVVGTVVDAGGSTTSKYKRRESSGMRTQTPSRKASLLPLVRMYDHIQCSQPDVSRRKLCSETHTVWNEVNCPSTPRSSRYKCSRADCKKITDSRHTATFQHITRERMLMASWLMDMHKCFNALLL